MISRTGPLIQFLPRPRPSANCPIPEGNPTYSNVHNVDVAPLVVCRRSWPRRDLQICPESPGRLIENGYKFVGSSIRGKFARSAKPRDLIPDHRRISHRQDGDFDTSPRAPLTQTQLQSSQAALMPVKRCIGRSPTSAGSIARCPQSPAPSEQPIGCFSRCRGILDTCLRNTGLRGVIPCPWGIRVSRAASERSRDIPAPDGNQRRQRAAFHGLR